MLQARPGRIPEKPVLPVRSLPPAAPSLKAGRLTADTKRRVAVNRQKKEAQKHLARNNLARNNLKRKSLRN